MQIDFKMNMLRKMENLLPRIGNTPLIHLNHEENNIYAKLESHNLFGSAKDRSAYNILYKALMQGQIGEESTVIESSSGNFAISLAGICKYLGIPFIAVIDPNINPINEKIINALSSRVMKVSRRDKCGGFLLTRMETVRTYCAKNKNAFWTNQYFNVNNPLAYYDGLGTELVSCIEKADFTFIAVSTGGMLRGLSDRIREINPVVKIVAVDVEGSMIFSDIPKKRNLPGIGSCLKPFHINSSAYDNICILSESEIKEGAKQLLEQHAVFCGASSGAIYAAITKTIQHKQCRQKNFLCVLPDGGLTYLDSVYQTNSLKNYVIPY